VVIALQENTLIVDALRSAHGVISIDLVSPGKTGTSTESAISATGSATARRKQ